MFPILFYTWRKYGFARYTPILARQKALRLAKTHTRLANKSITKFKICLSIIV